jgi:hypothetical protein
MAKGPADWFTGDVYYDVIVRGEQPSRIRLNTVRFTPAPGLTGPTAAARSQDLGRPNPLSSTMKPLAS